MAFCPGYAVFAGHVRRSRSCAAFQVMCGGVLGSLSGLAPDALPWLLYLGAVNTGPGFVLHLPAMEKTSAQTAALIFFLKPMMAPLFALAFLGEELRPNMVLGILCFLIGSGTAILPGLLAERRQAGN